LIFIGSLWWAIHTWEENIYKRGYDTARVEVAAEQAAKLKELTDAVKLLSKESSQRADALDVQQKAFAASTSAILTQIKNKPLVVANAKGDCKPTTEASKTWNDLQKSLQR
jgi:hypothetical protein